MPGVGDLLLRLRASLDDGDVVCFAGAQEALLYAALRALLSPDDHAIIVLPNYPTVETLAAQRCQVSGVALATEDWSLDIDAVAGAIRANTRLIAISFPNNPTGAVLDHARFAALVALCRRHGIWLLSYEVYRLTERDPRCRLPQAADVYERGISLGAVCAQRAKGQSRDPACQTIQRPRCGEHV